MITLEPVHGAMDEDGGWAASGLSRAGLGRFLKRAQLAVGLMGDVEVLLAGDKTLQRLNRTFRGKNKPTDVLSFPAAKEFATGHAGDLAVSLETAARQAAEHGHSLRDEVRVLLLHGLLHLSGMDHEVDTGEMAARERELRRELRLPEGLIERVEEGRVRGRRSTSARARAQVPRNEKTGTKAARGAANVRAERRLR